MSNSFFKQARKEDKKVKEKHMKSSDKKKQNRIKKIKRVEKQKE